MPQSQSSGDERSFAARFGTAFWVAEATIFRGPNRELTPTGQHVQTLVRIVAPILLGLALLSIRGRVKR